MKLVNALTGLNIELCENQVNVIVIESREVLTEYISELKRQILGEDGQFVLSDKDICRIDNMVEMIIISIMRVLKLNLKIMSKWKKI